MAARLRRVLPPPEVPWPPFFVAPPPNPVQRNSVADVWPVQTAALVPPLQLGGTWAATMAPSVVSRTDSGATGAGAVVAAVTAAAVAVAAAAGVWAALALRRQTSWPRPVGEKAVAMNALKAWRLFWMYDAYEPTAVRLLPQACFAYEFDT